MPNPLHNKITEGRDDKCKHLESRIVTGIGGYLYQVCDSCQHVVAEHKEPTPSSTVEGWQILWEKEFGHCCNTLGCKRNCARGMRIRDFLSSIFDSQKEAYMKRLELLRKDFDPETKQDNFIDPFQVDGYNYGVSDAIEQIKNESI